MYTLIIVDDDELIRKGLDKVIKWGNLGFCVLKTFSSAEMALDFIRENPVDVILTDIRMHQMTGLELIEEAKKLRKNIRSVVISGYDEFELAKKALILKVEDYLLKPLGEKDVEMVFVKLKNIMDAEQDVYNDGDKHDMNQEYELMRLLDNNEELSGLFEKKQVGKMYYEMLLINIEGYLKKENAELLSFRKILKQIFQDYFFCCVGSLWVALIPPESLNGMLMHIKEEFLKYPLINYQIIIGREVYNEAELVSSFWSALDLKKKSPFNEIIYYERERSTYKKEWNMIQNARSRMIEYLEKGNSHEVEVQVGLINEILNHYECKDIYYFYCNIVMKILKYFQLDSNGTTFLFAHRYFADTEQQYPERELLKDNFAQDIRQIQKTLWENSDSMRKLIVGKAKTMIEKRYGDDNLSLAMVANHLNISYGYLSTIFTKTTGSSFKTYLVNVRMEHARTLVLSRKYHIYEIAELVGYKNPRYFTDAFKKYYSCSPAEYINKFRGEQDYE